MEQAYLDQLPEDLQLLVEKIEHTFGAPIAVAVDAEKAAESAEQVDHLECNVDVHGAELLIPAPEHFPESSVLHELLHAQRFLLEGVPQIVACDDYLGWSPAFQTALTRLDNALEHLVIVPDELLQRPERRA